MGKESRYLVTGGGTAGHVYPGLAIAEAIRKREPDSQFLFVGSKSGAEERVVPAKGYDLRTLDVRGLPAEKNPFQHIKVLWHLVKALLQAVRILVDFKPHAIIGTGGYASAPVLLAALAMRSIRAWKGVLALQEQNIVPGRFNQWMCKWADFIGTSFPDTLRLLPTPKAYWSGYPLRKEMEQIPTANQDSKTKHKQHLGIPASGKVLLVFGGSSGARTINRALIKALPVLLAREDIHVLHATGFAQGSYDPEDEIRTSLARLFPDEAPLQRYRHQPYFDQIEDCYGIADLIVGRSGAGSVWELASAGVPSILVPKANLPGDHQVKNARFLERLGKTVVLYEKIDAGSPQGNRESIDSGKFVQTVLSILDNSNSHDTGPVEMGNLAGADQFYDLTCRFQENSQKKDLTIPTLKELSSHRIFSSNPENGIEWWSDSRLCSFLESKWKRGGKLLDADRRYAEYKTDQFLGSSRWQTRNLGVKFVGMIRYHRQIPILLHCINDRTPAPLTQRLLGGDFMQVGFIRRNALQALWRIRHYDEQVREAILQALTDPYYEVRSWAAHAVAKLSDLIVHDPGIEKLLLENLNDSWFEVVVSSLEPLGKISTNPDILSNLAPLLEHNNWKVQEATVRCLMDLLERDVIDLQDETEQLMNKIPMKGLDFYPRFPLQKTWESFLRFRSKQSSRKGPDPG